jgi:hypothetical protein
LSGARLERPGRHGKSAAVPVNQAVSITSYRGGGGGRMTEIADFAAKWRGLMTSTEPVDRPAAEAALRALYAAADFPEPAHFLWYDSPLPAIWAVTALAEGRDQSVDLFVPSVRQRSATRQRHDEARADLCRRLGASDHEGAQAAAGIWLESVMNPTALAAKIAAARFEFLEDAVGEEWMSHLTGADPAIAEVLAEEHTIFGHHGDGILGYGAAYAGAADIRHLMRSSSVAHLYSPVGCFSEIARDQHLADRHGAVPPPLIAAFWKLAEAAGMWWPFANAVVLSERPVDVQRGPGDSLTMVFSDGFTAEPYRTKPKSKPAARPKAEAPAVLKAKLPADHDARIAYLRKQAPSLPHYERYLAGEHEQVWKDLVALGADARSEAHAADALAVAYETMERVDRNVRILVERLNGLGYRFVDPGSGFGGSGLLGKLFGRGPTLHPPHVPPDPGTAKMIAKMEKLADGPLPLSVRAFFEVVGAVNLTGEHDTLAPTDSTVLPDALVVDGAEGALYWLENICEEDEDGSGKVICIAPDAFHKSNVSGGPPYAIALPAPVADAPLDDERHEVNFVEYLRIAFAWGGFPGWEEADAVLPDELAGLREGLIAF